MNLHELEKCYIACLLNGAKPQAITLRYLEKAHDEIKKLKEKGLVVIPKKLISGAATVDDNENHNFVEIYAARIVEVQKRIAIQEAAKGVLAEGKLPPDMQISNLREELDRIAENTGRTEIISAEQLQKKDFQNTEFIVDKIIPVGLTILMGAPKMGKSWLLLLWANLIASGLTIFGAKSKRVPVLYFTLEDSTKRCKYRMGKLFGQQSYWGNNLYFSEKVSGNIGVINAIKQTKVRVIIIDTYGAFATDIKDGNNYSETTKLIRELKDIADTMQVSIIAVHHTRKNKSEKDSDDWTTEIMGSQGWLGAADTIIFLDRKRGTNKATLKVTGRDVSDSFIKIKFEDCYWKLDDVESK